MAEAYQFPVMAGYPNIVSVHHYVGRYS